MQSEKSVDRRVQRTRSHLRDALMALILEKGYDAVTVQDITDRANLGRATFYLHYRDKDDLLLRTLEAVFDDLIAHMKPGVQALDQSPALRAFQHAADNSQFYRVLLGGQGGFAIFRKMRDYIADDVKKRFLPELAVQSTPADLLANYVAGALLALIGWWLENDMPYSPEQMAATYRRLIFSGIVDSGSAGGPDSL